jgi:hypothetical protein
MRWNPKIPGALLHFAHHVHLALFLAHWPCVVERPGSLALAALARLNSPAAAGRDARPARCPPDPA